MSKPQTRADREYIIENLPKEVRRVQVVEPSGKQAYKRPDDVDLDLDQIQIAMDGTPIVMRGKPGRKPKKPLKPVTPQIAEVDEARNDHISHSALLQEAKRDAEGDGVLNAIMAAMAEEAAAIEFERDEAARHGQDTTAHSAKRARVLKGMADTWLKRKQQIEGGLIDMESPAFQALFGLILQTFKDSMLDAGARPEFVETTFAKLVAALGDEGWKQDARARMKDTIK
jgi:hypothetical protein